MGGLQNSNQVFSFRETSVLYILEHVAFWEGDKSYRIYRAHFIYSAANLMGSGSGIFRRSSLVGNRLPNLANKL